MKHTAVQSSQIHSIAFEDGVLEITFKSKGGVGSTYQYRGDTAKQHADALMKAHTEGGSVGSYFIRNVKNDKSLAYTKLAQEAAETIDPSKVLRG
jgi:hypothetical protein